MRPVKLKPVSNDPNGFKNYYISSTDWIDETGDLFVSAGIACDTCDTPIFRPVVSYATVIMDLADGSSKIVHAKKDPDFVCKTCLLNLKIIKEQLETL